MQTKHKNRAAEKYIYFFLRTLEWCGNCNVPELMLTVGRRESSQASVSTKRTINDIRDGGIGQDLLNTTINHFY